MIITSGYIEHNCIKEYLGIVAGNVVEGLNVARDFLASIKDFTGGRIEGYEKMIESGRQQAFSQMESKASVLAADAVIGVKMDIMVFSPHDKGTVVGITVFGTAVKLFAKGEATGSNSGFTARSFQQEEPISRTSGKGSITAGPWFEWGK